MFAKPLENVEISSRLALLIGFGSLIAIIAFTGTDALRVLRQFRQQDEHIRRRFLLRNRLLNDIRSEVYLSGTYVRDYLLDVDPGRAAGFGRNLADVRTQMQSDLESYGAHLDPVEARDYAQLKGELMRYWAAIDPVLQWNPDKRRTSGYIFLRDEVFPRRAATLEIAGNIASLNEQQLNSGNQRTAELLSGFQARLALTLAGALILGLGMAGFATWRTLQLEARVHARFAEAVEARSQLAQLSARLVKVQEEERKSLSRELHDEIGQSLSAVLIETRTLLAGAASWPEDKIRRHVETIKAVTESAVRVVRNMALLLRPSMLDDLGLIPALKWQAREVAKRTGLDVTVDAEIQTDQLPEEYKTCIYRIVQEALNNCARHAQASAVRVRVQQKSETLRLSIEDNGRGFDVQHSKGMGLLGIEERATQLGGVFHIESELGAGSVLTVALPFRAADRIPQKETV